MNASVSTAGRLRIDLSPVGRAVPCAPSSRNDSKKLEIKLGSQTFSFPYYETRWRKYSSFTLAWHDGKRRRREKRNSFKKLRARAEEIALGLVNGETAMLQFTPADRASHLRCKELAAQVNIAVEVLVAEAVELRKKLGLHSPHKAVEYFLAHHRSVTQRNIPEIVTEFLGKRRIGGKWRRILEKMLDRFAKQFTGPFTSLAARDVQDWLDALGVGLRSRHNYRGAVLALLNFARLRGYVSKEFDLLSDVSDPEPPAVRVNIYTPEELVKLLNVAETYAGRGLYPYKKLVPFIAITAFAGVRHGEMNEEKIEHLDWRHVRFKTKRIIIGALEAKTGKARVVDMPENLIAWLQPYAQTSGRICPVANTSNALCRLRELAGITGPKRNSLRKSFISYRKAITGDIERVAEEAGNSKGVIRKTYLHVDEEMKEEAQRWFSIMPERAEILPLFTWSRESASVTKASPK